VRHSSRSDGGSPFPEADAGAIAETDAAAASAAELEREDARTSTAHDFHSTCPPGRTREHPQHMISTAHVLPGGRENIHST